METDANSSDKNFGNFDQEKEEIVEREKEDGSGKQKNNEISENKVKNGDGSIVELQFRFKDLSSDNGNHDVRSNDVSNLNN